MDRYAYDQALAELSFARDTQLLYYDSSNSDSGRTWHSETEIKVLLRKLVSESMKRHSLPISPGGTTIMERYGKLILIGGYGTGTNVSFSIEPTVFDDIISTLNFPRRFVQGMNSPSGNLGRYLEHEERNGQNLPRYLNVIFQTPSVLRPLTLVLRHDVLHPLTTIFLFTSDPSDLHTLVKRLRDRDTPFRTNPQAFLNLIFEEYSATSEDHKRDLEAQIFKLSLTPPESRNYEALAAGMSALETLVGFEVQAGLFLRETLEAIGQLHQTRYTHSTTPSPTGGHPGSLSLAYTSTSASIPDIYSLPTTQLLSDDLAYLTLATTLRAQNVRSLKDRLTTYQSITQTLLLMPCQELPQLIDDVHSMNTSLRQVSEDSRVLCSVVVGLFPALVVAAVLGSGILVLQTGGGVEVSRLFSVFWAVWGGVMGVVLGGWVVFRWWRGRGDKEKKKRKRKKNRAFDNVVVTGGVGMMGRDMGKVETGLSS